MIATTMAALQQFNKAAVARQTNRPKNDHQKLQWPGVSTDYAAYTSNF